MFLFPFKEIYNHNLYFKILYKSSLDKATVILILQLKLNLGFTIAKLDIKTRNKVSYLI